MCPYKKDRIRVTFHVMLSFWISELPIVWEMWNIQCDKFKWIECIKWKTIVLFYWKQYDKNTDKKMSNYIYRTARICWTTGIISKNSLKTSKKLIYLPKLKVYIVMRVNFCKLFSINTTSCHTERVFSGILHHVQMYIKTFSSSFDRFI